MCVVPSLYSVLYPCSVGVFAVMYGRRLFSSVIVITERRDMDLYAVPLSMSLLGFVTGTMFNIHIVWYYVVVMSSFKHTREKCESKRTYVF